MGLAAEQGDLRAQLALGQALSAGQGITRDLDAALDWYRAAAAGGYARAQYKLGILLAGSLYKTMKKPLAGSTQRLNRACSGRSSRSSRYTNAGWDSIRISQRRAIGWSPRPTPVTPNRSGA